ncbi:MAG: hypothetical protein U0894_16620 [Pirellulales bacterium]
MAKIQIEELLRQAQKLLLAWLLLPLLPVRQQHYNDADSNDDCAESAMAPAAVAAGQAAARPGTGVGSVGDDISFLLHQAEQAIASVDDPIESAIPGISTFSFRDFGGAATRMRRPRWRLLQDVDLDLRVKQGERRCTSKTF